MELTFDRREFAQVLTLGLGVAALPALNAQQSGQAAPTGPKKVRIGVSTLAWNVSTASVDTFEQALKDISELGYSGYETVSPILETYDANGMLPKLMDKYHISLKAGYLGTNVTDVSQRKDQVAKAITVAKLIKKYGGTYCVIGPTADERQRRQDRAGAVDNSHRTTSISKRTRRISSPALTRLEWRSGTRGWAWDCINIPVPWSKPTTRFTQ